MGWGGWMSDWNEWVIKLNTLRLRQNGRHFPDDIFKWIFLNENIWISIKVSLKFVSKGLINNIPALVQIMAWRLPGDKPLSEPMLVSLLRYICVTRPQIVNGLSGDSEVHIVHISRVIIAYTLESLSSEWLKWVDGLVSEVLLIIYFNYFSGQSRQRQCRSLTAVMMRNLMNHPRRRRNEFLPDHPRFHRQPCQLHLPPPTMAHHTFSFKNIHLKIPSTKWRPFCLSVSEFMSILQLILRFKFCRFHLWVTSCDLLCNINIGAFQWYEQHSTVESRAPLTRENQLVALAPWTPNFSDAPLATAHMPDR